MKEYKLSEKHMKLHKNSDGTTSIVINFHVAEGGKRTTFNKSVCIEEYLTYSDALKAAQTIRDDALTKNHLGRLIVTAPTVGRLYQRKFELIKVTLSTKRKHDTIYKLAIKKYENTRIDKVKTSDVQESVNNYAKDHSQDQIERCITVWHQIYQAAQMDEIPVIDRTLSIVHPKQTIPAKPEKNVIIGSVEFEKFMEAVTNYHVYDPAGRWQAQSIWYLLRILQYTGMQPGEALALLRSDIDLDSRTISVSKLIGSSDTEKTVEKFTKNGFRVRVIPISEDLQPIIEELMQWNRKYSRMICDYDGSLYNIDWLSNRIHLVSLSCGVKFNMYMLRHTFSNDLYKKKVNPRNIQDLMGHASENMSLQYARSDEEELRKVIDKRKFS